MMAIVVTNEMSYKNKAARKGAAFVVLDNRLALPAKLVRLLAIAKKQSTKRLRMSLLGGARWDF